MGQEIERKFLVVSDEWRSPASGQRYRQAYLPTQSGTTVRVRVVGEVGYLTIKGPTQGITRSEFEYEIPVADAEQLLHELCDRPLIEKTRYRVEVAGHLWEIDEFEGENHGLIVAEVELEEADQPLELPSWIGVEVSDDPRYYNSSLAKHPFSHWSSVH